MLRWQHIYNFEPSIRGGMAQATQPRYSAGYQFKLLINFHIIYQPPEPNPLRNHYHQNLHEQLRDFSGIIAQYSPSLNNCRSWDYRCHYPLPRIPSHTPKTGPLLVFSSKDHHSPPYTTRSNQHLNP